MEKQMMYLQKICKLKPRMIQYLGGGIVVVVDSHGEANDRISPVNHKKHKNTGTGYVHWSWMTTRALFLFMQLK